MDGEKWEARINAAAWETPDGRSPMQAPAARLGKRGKASAVADARTYSNFTQLRREGV